MPDSRQMMLMIFAALGLFAIGYLMMSYHDNDNNISYYKQFNTIYYNYNESIRINTQNTINNIQLYDNEILYGLQLILCHLKLLTNYYKNINVYKFANMSNTHISSIFRLLHNMCIITIYFNNNIFQ